MILHVACPLIINVYSSTEWFGNNSDKTSETLAATGSFHLLMVVSLTWVAMKSLAQTLETRSDIVGGGQSRDPQKRFFLCLERQRGASGCVKSELSLGCESSLHWHRGHYTLHSCTPPSCPSTAPPHRPSCSQFWLRKKRFPRRETKQMSPFLHIYWHRIKTDHWNIWKWKMQTAQIRLGEISLIYSMTFIHSQFQNSHAKTPLKMPGVQDNG